MAVNKLKSGAWQADYNIKVSRGKYRKEKCAYHPDGRPFSKKDAENWERGKILERNRNMGRLSQPILRSLGDAVAHYKSLARYKELRPRTKKRYEQLLRNIEGWSVKNGKEFLSSWDRDVAREFESWAYGRFKGKGVNHILLMIKTLFQEELLRQTPAIKENPFILIKLKKIKRKNAKIFTPQELEMIFDVSDPLRTHLWNALLYTGMRVGELLSLPHENWDGENIKIAEGRDNAITGDWEPKTFKGLRVIPNLRPEAVAAFNYFSSINKGKPFLVSGDKIKSENYPSSKFRAVRLRIKTKYKYTLKGSPHSFRHTFTSLLWGLDVPDKVVADLLGHEDIRTTQRVYAQLTTENLKAGMEKLKGLKYEQSTRESIG